MSTNRNKKTIKIRRFDFDAFWNQIPFFRRIECLGFDCKHRRGFICAYFLYSPSEISDYTEAVSEASKYYCHDLELDSKSWRLNYDEEELSGLSEVEARKKYQNDEINKIIFDYSQYPSLPRLDIDELALFYDEHKIDIKAGFERWSGTYTDYRSKVTRLAHHYYEEGEADQHPQNHKLYKAFVATCAIRHWLLMYQEILDFNRDLSKNNKKHEPMLSSIEVINTMDLEKIMADEPFVITTYHQAAEPIILKPEPASEQLSLPINYEGDYMLVTDKTGAVHFKKRQTDKNLPVKIHSKQSDASRKTLGLICKQLRNLTKKTIIKLFPGLQK